MVCAPSRPPASSILHVLVQSSVSAPVRAAATVPPLPVSGGRMARRSTPLSLRPRTPRRHKPGRTLHRLCIWRQCHVFTLAAHLRYALPPRIRLLLSSKPPGTIACILRRARCTAHDCERMDALDALLPFRCALTCEVLSTGAFVEFLGDIWVEITQRERA